MLEIIQDEGARKGCPYKTFSVGILLAGIIEFCC
jgi:hypothetical protein